MLLKRSFLVSLCIWVLSFSSFAQGHYVVKNKKGITKINFKLISNVIIIPVEVNGIALSFLLDTGVKTPIIFNFIKTKDSLKIKNSKTIYLKGLGVNKYIEALKSSHNSFKIGDAINTDQDFYVIFDNAANFSPKLGIPVHGIIGTDFFKDLIIDINYSKKQIKAYNPEKFKYKKCKKSQIFSLQFYNTKPYINVFTKIKENYIPLKLLIDSGNSDAIWLFKNDSLGLSISDNYFKDFLGYGLSGNVLGRRSKLNEVKLKSFALKDVKVAFPDNEFITVLRKIEGRNGSLGGEILKRFNLIFNYKNGTVRFKKNRHFKDDFSYNKAGIDLENDGIRLVTEYERDTPDVENNNSAITIKAVFATNKKTIVVSAYSVSQVRPNSPAERIGLKKGDKLLAINGKDTSNYSLQELTNFFFDKEGTKLRLLVERIGIKINMLLTLESPIK